jgi:hypothetical protein
MAVLILWEAHQEEKKGQLRRRLGKGQFSDDAPEARAAHPQFQNDMLISPCRADLQQL